MSIEILLKGITLTSFTKHIRLKSLQGSVTKMLSKLLETSVLDECLPCRITKLSSYASSVTFVHPRWISCASRRILARSSSAASCQSLQPKPHVGLVT